MKLVFGAPDIEESLRLAVRSIASGECITWPERHGEEAIYVLEGSVDLDGTTVPAGGAVILHADAPCTLTAVEAARLAVFSSVLGATSGPSDRSVHPERHVVGPRGWFRSGSPGGSQATWFADSTCEGCDVALFLVERDTPGNRGRSHSHTADEILFLVEGAIRLGAHEVRTGEAVFIPADTRYAVTCGDTKHAFLNYRARASMQHYDGDAEPLPESGLGRGGELVGDLL